MKTPLTVCSLSQFATADAATSGSRLCLWLQAGLFTDQSSCHPAVLLSSLKSYPCSHLTLPCPTPERCSRCSQFPSGGLPAPTVTVEESHICEELLSPPALCLRATTLLCSPCHVPTSPHRAAGETVWIILRACAAWFHEMNIWRTMPYICTHLGFSSRRATWCQN